MRSRVSSFKWEYPLLSLRSSSSILRLFARLLVTSISPFIFHSITCFRRQFRRKMWQIQLAFRFLISCRILLCSLTLSNTSSFLTWSVQLISILLQHHISKLSRRFWSAARSVQVSASHKTMLQMWHFTSFFIFATFPENILKVFVDFRTELTGTRRVDGPTSIKLPIFKQVFTSAALTRHQAKRRTSGSSGLHSCFVRRSRYYLT